MVARSKHTAPGTTAKDTRAKFTYPMLVSTALSLSLVLVEAALGDVVFLFAQALQ